MAVGMITEKSVKKCDMKRLLSSLLFDLQSMAVPRKTGKIYERVTHQTWSPANEVHRSSPE